MCRSLIFWFLPTRRVNTYITFSSAKQTLRISSHSSPGDISCQLNHVSGPLGGRSFLQALKGNRKPRCPLGQSSYILEHAIFIWRERVSGPSCLVRWVDPLQNGNLKWESNRLASIDWGFTFSSKNWRAGRYDIHNNDKIRSLYLPSANGLLKLTWVFISFTRK